MFGIESLAAIRENKPLVHCITNYVTVNDCANALLAIGASPVMADDIREAAEIVSIANALVINIGTLNERTIASMFAAGKKANDLGIPVILDPVGAGASRLRTETARALVNKIRFAIIRGNLSEIVTLAGGEGKTRGVDTADAGVSCEVPSFSATAIARTGKLAGNLAKAAGAVVAVTGAIDVVSDGSSCVAIGNGHVSMSRITGCGCMLSALLGAFCAGGGSRGHFESTVAGVCAMGIAGEYAASVCPDGRTGSFRVALIDGLSLIDDARMKEKMKIENIAL